MSRIDRSRERLIGVYRKKAKHYDITSRFSPVPGYPQRALRVRAVRALGLSPGDTVVDLACGTGLNFPLIERLIGPDGRIVGVDMTDAMLARAQDRIDTNDWRNVRLVQAAADFGFPGELDAIVSTYALTQVPECAEVIALGAAALSGGGRWVVLDLSTTGSCAVRGRRFAQPCTRNWSTFAGSNRTSGPHSWRPAPRRVPTRRPPPLAATTRLSAAHRAVVARAERRFATRRRG